jgi:hypothetical protein
MKIMKIVILFCISILSFGTNKAQDYVFRVMASSGSNVFKPVSATNWAPVKRGVAFNSGDVVKIVDKAYLGLIHNTGKTVELINPGEFKIDDIVLDIPSQKKGIGGKYTEYVINTLDNSVDFDEADELITRGGEKTIHVVLPATSEVLNSKQIISWEESGNESTGTYTISVKGIFEDLLLEEEVNTKEYVLDLDKPALENENMFVVTISSNGGDKVTSNEYALDRLSEEEQARYFQETTEIRENLGALSTLDYVVLASYYEGKGLIVDANTAYQQAIKQSPELRDVQELFEIFKGRHNINN